MKKLRFITVLVPVALLVAASTGGGAVVPFTKPTAAIGARQTRTINLATYPAKRWIVEPGPWVAHVSGA